jgi:hypothetical protein
MAAKVFVSHGRHLMKYRSTQEKSLMVHFDPSETKKSSPSDSNGILFI